MSHHLEIDFGMSGPELRLVCTATPDSPCRMRPADDRESWSYYDYPDLIDGECWAAEWVEAGGMETMASADGVTWPTIPVTVEYDEGVVLAPVAPHPPLWPDGGAAMIDTPPSILDRIDLQLVAGSDEVVLTRAEAEILALLLHDLLGTPREGGRR